MGTIMGDSVGLLIIFPPILFITYYVFFIELKRIRVEDLDARIKFVQSLRSDTQYSLAACQLDEKERLEYLRNRLDKLEEVLAYLKEKRNKLCG